MCGNYKRYGHPTNDCWVNTNNNNNNKNKKAGACYECGNTGHIKRNCPKLKNYINDNGNDIAQGRAYALGGRYASSDSNVITSMFLLNNRYATILFDTGVDRISVSTTFSALINITPTTLENHYDVELADGKIIGFNTIIRGDCDDEPSDDDEDDDTDEEDEEPTNNEGDDEEEEEHLAPANSFTILVVDPVSSARDTKAFETDELELPMSTSMEARIVKHVAAPIPPTSPAYDQAPLGHRAAMIRMRDDIPKEDMPPRRRFVLTAPPPGGDVAQSSAATAARPPREDVGYVRALQASKHMMMTSIEEVNLRISYQEQRTAYETELDMRQRRWLELLSDYDCDIRYHPGKVIFVADALSRKEWSRPLRVRALVMTMGLNLPKKILEVQTEALKPENLSAKDVGGMLRKDLPKEKLEPRAYGTLCLNNKS
nr:reverse transcriptase domain-containing protein [Tanacetum cinerariifolium]